MHETDAGGRATGAGELMADWQPIETAPKDGTRIVAIGLTPSGQWCTATVIAWSELLNEWAGQSGHLSDPTFRKVLYQPTKWKPMPVEPD